MRNSHPQSSNTHAYVCLVVYLPEYMLPQCCFYPLARTSPIPHHFDFFEFLVLEWRKRPSTKHTIAVLHDADSHIGAPSMWRSPRPYWKTTDKNNFPFLHHCKSNNHIVEHLFSVWACLTWFLSLVAAVYYCFEANKKNWRVSWKMNMYTVIDGTAVNTYITVNKFMCLHERIVLNEKKTELLLYEEQIRGILCLNNWRAIDIWCCTEVTWGGKKFSVGLLFTHHWWDFHLEKSVSEETIVYANIPGSKDHFKTSTSVLQYCSVFYPCTIWLAIYN